MVHKSVIFLAISCISAVTSASNLLSALDTTLHKGNGNFILQLNSTVCIKDFVPRFMDNALEIFTQSMGEDKFVKRNNNKIVRRDTEDEQVHVFDAYEFGSKFKGITVKFEDLTLVRALLGSFNHDIIKIIPDMDIKYDLPTQKGKYSKRYYVRNVQKKKHHQRAGNFHYDSYKHDKNCPHAHEDDKKELQKRATTCISGSLKKKKGDGYNGYCCATQADCRESCISGKCDGPKKPSTTTKKTTTKKTTTKKTTTKKTTTKKTTTKKTTTKKTTTKKSTTKKATTKKTTTKKSTTTKKPTTTTTTTKKSTTSSTATTTTKATSTTANAASTSSESVPTSTAIATTTTTTTTKSATTTGTATTNVPEASFISQKDAQWNLVRISEKALDLKKPYVYNSRAASDVYVYVIDDGMQLDHVEFEGRATWGFSAFKDISKLGSGHGTHVGGIIAGKTYGAAKKANLIAVQILDENGDGAISDILAGLDFVKNDAKKYPGKAVINMSVGLDTGGKENAVYVVLNTILSSVVTAGIPMVGAAGNWDTDTCGVLPGGNKDVFAVGATDKKDIRADYSCWGTCVQINAPGTEILSSYVGSNTATAVLSGTSMASPHVAGVAALVISDMSDATPAKVYAKLNSLATTGVVKSTINDTTKNLLFNGQTLTEN